MVRKLLFPSLGKPPSNHQSSQPTTTGPANPSAPRTLLHGHPSAPQSSLHGNPSAPRIPLRVNLTAPNSSLLSVNPTVPRTLTTAGLPTNGAATRKALLFTNAQSAADQAPLIHADHAQATPLIPNIPAPPRSWLPTNPPPSLLPTNPPASLLPTNPPASLLPTNPPASLLPTASVLPTNPTPGPVRSLQPINPALVSTVDAPVVSSQPTTGPPAATASRRQKSLLLMPAPTQEPSAPQQSSLIKEPSVIREPDATAPRYETQPALSSPSCQSSAGMISEQQTLPKASPGLEQRQSCELRDSCLANDDACLSERHSVDNDKAVDCFSARPQMMAVAKEAVDPSCLSTTALSPKKTLLHAPAQDDCSVAPHDPDRMEHLSTTESAQMVNTMRQQACSVSNNFLLADKEIPEAPREEIRKAHREEVQEENMQAGEVVPEQESSPMAECLAEDAESVKNRSSTAPDGAVQVRRPRTRRSLLGLMPATTGQHHIGMMQTGRLPTMEEDEVEIVGFKEAEPESDAVVYKVFYTKQRKKHKTFESGVLVVYRLRTLLFTDEGKQVTVFTTKKTWKTVGEGESLGWVRDFLIEVDNEVPYTDYMSGRVFLGILHAQACTKDNSDAQEPPRKRARTSITGLSSTTAPVPARSAAAAAVPPRQSKCPPEISNVLVLEPPDVYLDAFLASKLQKHQVQGVKFLYRAFRRPSGAILADGMGLGKSLQALSFLWVILSKKIQGRPLAKKAAIVCPSSLCDAWVLEIRKWMGEARMKPTLVQAMNPEQTIQNFCAGKSTVNDHILIISYDFLRRYAKLLTHIDVLVCDEGHRMSHESTCASKALRKIGKVRIVLSGTPLQNNLDELFSLCDFVCPHIIADWNVFKKAILKSRDPNATEEEKRLGEARARQLDEVTKPFLLRRTTDILNLPPKNVFLVFLPFTDAQEYLSVLNDGFANPLGTLQKLRRICFLSKIQVLRNFLKSMWEEMPQENIVLVSSFTTCLDAIGKMLKELEAPYIRLDGSTATKDRQLIVDRWNSSSKTGRLVFLLSSRAGGVGLNLQQGGRRMVIVDPDWNPANDLQVMGRLWRMGQKKEVFIYRLCMAGSVEEKILQRQEMKVDLAALAVDGKSETSLDNWDDLRQLFHLEGIVENRTVTLSPFVRARVEKLRAVANAVLVPWGPYVGTAEDAAESSATENSLAPVHMHGQDPGSAPQKSGEQLGAEGPSVPPQYAVSAHVEPASLNVPVIPPQATEPSSALQGPNILPHNSSFAHLELVVLDEPDTPPQAPDPWSAPQGPCVPPQDPSSALRGPAQLDALMIPPHGLDIWSLPQWLNAAGTPMILPQPVYGENNAQELMVQPLTGPQKPTEVPKRSICLIAADDPEAKRAKLDDGGDVTSREEGKSLMGCPWREENEHPLPVSGVQLREEEDTAKKGDDSITRNDAPQVGGISVTPHESRIYYS